MNEEFLRETRFCDVSAPEIGSLAGTFADHRTERDAAVDVFGFVRDAIAYEVGNWQRSASQTLRRRRGTCTNSANLMVAILRSLGIPAGYGVMTVSGREYFGPAIPQRLSARVAERSKHIYVGVHLDGRWLRCDPSDDAALSTASGHVNPQCTPVEWDGHHDALLNLDPAHVLADEFPLGNIDALMDKPMRLAMQLPAMIGNHFIQFLREQGSTLQEPADVESRFHRWLGETHPWCQLMYRMLPAPRNTPAPVAVA